MVMQRRSFFGTLLSGFATALGISGFTYGVQNSARQKLVTAWNQYYRKHKVIPKYIIVSPKLYKQFESELTAIERFIPYTANRTEPALAIKSGLMVMGLDLQGWEFVIA
jgi:hypothetical protein